jgi:hypothetical protein
VRPVFQAIGPEYYGYISASASIRIALLLTSRLSLQLEPFTAESALSLAVEAVRC